MSPETIHVDNLSKTYQVPEREGGFGAAVRSFFKRKYKDVKAVQQVNFKIAQGEIVGFLGPNGAGKRQRSKCFPACFIQQVAMQMCLALRPGNSSLNICVP